MVYYKAVYSDEAQKNLAKFDPAEKEKILKKLHSIFQMPNPMVLAKKLTNVEPPTYRFRIADYRVIFRIDEKTGELAILMILRIAHRKEAYR